MEVRLFKPTLSLCAFYSDSWRPMSKTPFPEKDSIYEYFAFAQCSPQRQAMIGEALRFEQVLRGLLTLST